MKLVRDKKKELAEYFKEYPKGGYIILQLEEKIPAISTSYGYYEFTNFALYFSRNKIDMKDEEFSKLYLSLDKYLASKNVVLFRSSLITNLHTGKLEEIELIFHAYLGDFILDALEKTSDIIIDMLTLQRTLLSHIAKMMHDHLKEKGYSSTYPRPVKYTEIGKLDLNTDFFIELKPAQKLLYMTTLLKEIKDKCGSEIEFLLGKELAIQNIPFIQQHEVTKSFPEKKTGERMITKPDMLLWNDEYPIAIYCDGHDFHEKTPEQAFRDRNIDRELQSMGFRVLRFTGSEIKNNVTRCIEEVKKHFLGSEFSKTPNQILLKQLQEIDFKKLNEWEKRFRNSMFDYVTSDKRLTLKQERKLRQILDKSSSSGESE